MGRRIGYGKLGRSMPLTLDKCGNLGGDVEMVAVVKTLALRHPDDTFVLVGRNSGEDPRDVGLPENVHNPWRYWQTQFRDYLKKAGLTDSALTVEGHRKLRELFRELTLPTFKSLDNIVMWVGQHGTSNMSIPTVADRSELTKPQDWCAYYASFILDGINEWRDADPLNREEIWLNADSRNRHKMRDLKWPLRHPILTQFKFSHKLKHERYGADKELFDDFMQAKDVTTGWPRPWNEGLGWEHDGAVWTSTVRNEYSRLEINGLLPGTPFGDLISYDENYERPGTFGLFINEARKAVSDATKRVKIVQQWVLPAAPHFIHGTWSNDSQASLGREIKPAPWDEYYPRLHSVLATLTTPSSGSGFATAKPWEAFAGGTVCFFHPEYDTQDNILGDAPGALRSFLRVATPREFRDRLRMLQEDRGLWLEMVRMQREHFDNAVAELRYMRMIEERIYGKDAA